MLYMIIILVEEKQFICYLKKKRTLVRAPFQILAENDFMRLVHVQFVARA